ncbi:hypothetical protein N0V93_009334 [Gnomoniopsis smithogilvyi]|uniref:Cytochrome P450 n=1 Tax=Gnomoniopsis smithogilvyi TaxID=1191159 RepID=A0A9W8YKN1_9PEZI|nr:hypothetical protein N0V93_009334 [Gnomoniopsis smithogilvyi]
MIYSVAVTAFLAYITWSLVSLEINARKAQALGIHCVRIPFDVTNVLWLALQPSFWAILDRLPVPWSSYPDFVRLSRRDWQFREKSELAVRLGPVWALVTPVTFYLQFTDPQAIKGIFARPSHFMRPVKEYKLLEVYGPCISTAGWEDWARHRKIIAAPFNESIMKFVWDEATRQTKAMLDSWIESQSTGIPSVQKDTQTLALNVLAATALKKTYNFRGSGETGVQDEAGSYRDTIQIVLNNAILIMLIPYRFLHGPLIPRKLARVGEAAEAFKSHMVGMLDNETQALRKNQAGSGGILSGLVRALDLHHNEPSADSQGKKGLSIEETLGDLFVINFAGYDTSAAALSFSLHLLAIYPEVQEWLAEEIAAVSTSEDVADWDYKAMFPRLKRCQAILLETLRLYPPIVSLPKWTGANAQELDIGHETVTIPPGVYTAPHLIAVHTHPDYWTDPYSWTPRRWIFSGQVPTSGLELFVQEKIVEPLANTYFPWSETPQNCPGKKFIQVEAVAVFARLFKSHRLSVKAEAGENAQATKIRLLRCVNNVNMDVILRMEHSKDLRLICTEA